MDYQEALTEAKTKLRINQIQKETKILCQKWAEERKIKIKEFISEGKNFPFVVSMEIEKEEGITPSWLPENILIASDVDGRNIYPQIFRFLSDLDREASQIWCDAGAEVEMLEIEVEKNDDFCYHLYTSIGQVEGKKIFLLLASKWI